MTIWPISSKESILSACYAHITKTKTNKKEGGEIVEKSIQGCTPHTTVLADLEDLEDLAFASRLSAFLCSRSARRLAFVSSSSPELPADSSW